MLCQQCQVNEATVHFSALMWRSDDVDRYLCASCYPKVEAERTAFYSSEPEALPVMDIERITASEYLEFADKARSNSADAPVFRHITEELKRLPATRERLALELLAMSLLSLEKGDNAWRLVGLGGCFGNSVTEMKSADYPELLEKIIRRFVELMVQADKPGAEDRFGYSLTIAANALQQANYTQWSTLMEDLKAESSGHELSRVCEVIDYLERKLAELEQRRIRKRDRKNKSGD